jgi:DNA-binding SARP family transcriptional activator/DNA-binding XRE family transcriptional regulator
MFASRESRLAAGHQAGSGFGALVREFRVRAGLTQKRLAAAAGISIGALRDLEQGRTQCPRWAAVDAIAVALNLDRPERAELARAWSGGHMNEDPWDAGTRWGGAGVHIGVLGPLTGHLAGAAVALGPARQRAVLGLLALYWPARVSREVIVDVLWGERPPPSAVAQVQGYVSGLRRLLDPRQTLGKGNGSVRLAGYGYQLSDAVDLDLAQFRTLNDRARAAAAQGDCHLACALYQRSLGLWRGEVLTDIELLRAHPAVGDVTRRYRHAVLGFARAAAAISSCERALPYLHTLCEYEPLDEQAHAELMTALAFTGQQAAALRLFGQLSKRLDAELGVRPGPKVAAAHLRILRQEPATAQLV